MKVERISEHIWSLRSWMLISVSVWVVADSDGVTLVDTGFKFMGKGILKFVDQLNLGPLRRILLTHGHSDHVGSVNKIVQEKSIPVYAHRIELPYINGELPYPRRKRAEAGITKGLVRPLEEEPNGELEAVAGLKPYLTPGHSPGHVVYYHEQDGILLAGDLFTSKNGRLQKPMAMFTADMQDAFRSSSIIQQLNPKVVEVCHGKPVTSPVEQLDEYLRESGVASSISLTSLTHSKEGEPADHRFL